MSNRSSAPVVLGLVLLVLVALLGALWVGGDSPDGGLEPVGLPRPLTPAPARSGPALDAAALDADAAGSLGASRAELPVAAEGVRLAGEGRLTGRVVERTSGAGVGDVRVELVPLPPQGTEVLGRVLRLTGLGEDLADRAEPVATTRTGPDGAFAFEGVRAGTYFAEARGDLAVPDPIGRVVVAPSGDGGPATLYVRAGGAVAGRVLAADGRPVAGADVLAGQGEGVVLEALRSGDVTVVRTRTDGDGRFRLGGLPPGGGFRVSAVHPGLGLAFARGVEVVAGEVTPLDLRFAPAGAITGVVLAEDASGDAAPVPGASVSVVPRGLRELFYAEEVLEAASATADPEGRFRLDPVPPGTVDVLAWAPGHLPATVGPVLVGTTAAADAGEVLLERGPVLRGRVVDEAGEPVEGALVLYPMADPRRGMDLSLAPFLAQALDGFAWPETDAEGRFVAGPFPGRAPYRLQVLKLGYAEERLRWDPATDDDEVVVVLRAGGAVEGIVVDSAARRPVTRFTVQGFDLLEEGADTPGPRNPFSGGKLVEDPRGRFRVEGVRAGDSELFVTAPGYRAATVRAAVTAGETTRGLVVDLSRGHVVRGVVVDGDGEPVAGARVAATRGSDAIARAERDARSGRRRGQPDPVELRDFQERMPAGALAFGVGLGLVESELTDDDGRFALTSLGPGTWTVHATHRDFASGSSERVELAGEPDLPALDVPADDGSVGTAAPALDGLAAWPASAEVTVTMSRGSRVHGRVTDRFERPVEGAMVLAFSPGVFASGRTAGGGYQDETDAAGDYELAHVVPGGYFLVVTRGNEALDLFSFLGTMQLELVTVPEDGELRRDLVDQSAAATRVHGVVREAGEPVRGGTVVALALEPDNMLGVDLKLGAVDTEGRYEFEGLAEGPYQFRYEARGKRATLEVDVPDRPDARIDLDLPSGVVEGRVVDQATGAGVRRARLVLRDLDGAVDLGGLIGELVGDGLASSFRRSDGDGGFRFTGLAPGRYELTVTPPGGGADGPALAPVEPVTVEVVEGAPPVTLTLALPPTLAIRGLVTDAVGVPVAGARVAARRADGVALPRSTRTADDGTYELRGVGTGPHLVSVRADGFAPVAGLPVDVPETGGERDVVLTRGTEVTVLVLDAVGAPALGAVADLEPAAGGGSDLRADQALESWFAGKGVAGADGLVELGRLAPGTYDLVVTRGSATVRVPGVEVPDDGILALEARLP